MKIATCTSKKVKHVIIFVILATRYGIPDEDCHMHLQESETPAACHAVQHRPRLLPGLRSEAPV